MACIPYKPSYLFELRQALCMTQSDLAFHIDCSRLTVVNWERSGRIKGKYLKRLLRLTHNRPAGAPMVDVYKRHANFTRYPRVSDPITNS